MSFCALHDISSMVTTVPQCRRSIASSTQGMLAAAEASTLVDLPCILHAQTENESHIFKTHFRHGKMFRQTSIRDLFSRGLRVGEFPVQNRQGVQLLVEDTPVHDLSYFSRHDFPSMCII